MKRIIDLLGMSLVFYIAGSVTSASFSIPNWSSATRIFTAFFGVFGLFMVFSFHEMRKND